LAVASPNLIEGLVYDRQRTVSHQVRNLLPDGGEIYRIKMSRIKLDRRRRVTGNRSPPANRIKPALPRFVPTWNFHSQLQRKRRAVYQRA
jgi:hypothetical protein